jgi:hypothetical protein
VVTERPIEEALGVGRVHPDLESGARAVTRLLINHGHRRIGFIGNFEDVVIRISFVQDLTSRRPPSSLGRTCWHREPCRRPGTWGSACATPEIVPTQVFERNSDNRS